MNAARRRLREEMGVECELTHVVTFEYRADVGEGLTEHEVDHVFQGSFSGVPSPDAAEVSGFRWELLADVREDCAANPDRYSVWLPLALARLARHLAE